MNRKERIQALRREIEERQNYLDSLEAKLTDLLAEESNEEISERGKSLGINLYKDMKIIATQEMADYVIKGKPEWVNPPARLGDVTTVKYLANDGIQCASNGWVLYFPNEMIIRAVQQG